MNNMQSNIHGGPKKQTAYYYSVTLSSESQLS